MTTSLQEIPDDAFIDQMAAFLYMIFRVKEIYMATKLIHRFHHQHLHICLSRE